MELGVLDDPTLADEFRVSTPMMRTVSSRATGPTPTPGMRADI